MKLSNIKRGFTLIELLVVITIIGILATGATTVYTSQIQKARDTTRINDVKALQSAVEQVYQDNSEYPYSTRLLKGATGITGITDYMESVPADPKHNQPCNNGGDGANATDCAYTYVTGSDSNSILYGEYEVSTAFEALGNVDKKAALDGGGLVDELARYEVGIDIAGNDSGIGSATITATGKGACSSAGVAVASPTALVIINGNATTPANECN